MEPNISTLISVIKAARFISSLIKKNDRNVNKAMALSLIYGKPIRISFSYLYQVRNDHRYLLVYNSRGNRYQPIGGVYKGQIRSMLYNPEIAEGDFITKAPKDDFRAVLRKPHYLRKFYDEFLTGKYRETSYYREFHEEMVVPGYLRESLFTEQSLIASKISDLTKVEVTDEVINFYHFDIIALDPSPEQRAYFEEMPSVNEGAFLWVAREDMKKHGIYKVEVSNPKSIQDHKFLPLAPHTSSVI